MKTIIFILILSLLTSKVFPQIKPPAKSATVIMTSSVTYDTDFIEKFAFVEGDRGVGIVHTENLISAKEISTNYAYDHDLFILPIWQVLTFWLVALFFAIGVLRFSRQSKEHYSRYENEWYWAEKYQTSALAKLHTVRNNYSVFRFLLETGKNELATEFADKSAHYFSYSLRTWNEGVAWSVFQELELLSRFYEAQRIIKKDVTIAINIETDIQGAYFIPEVFPTLLENSMKYAFEKFTGECTFTISAKRVGKLIEFIITDNGISSQLYNYISKERYNSGLAILRRRLKNEFKRKKISLRDVKPLWIETECPGTTIHIKFPYAEAF
ncbi:MAG: hypothetical protein JST10_14935 [Bacteroidetes bacterium]|nr:hypothetical protein [Bacteroidota bacterium]